MRSLIVGLSLLLASCNPEVTMEFGLMGDSHHVKIAGALVHEFLARDSAPTLHFLGGYIGLKCGDADNYLLPRVERLYQKGRFDGMNKLIIFVGTNDLGIDVPSCVSALENTRMLMPRLLVVGPSQLGPDAASFYMQLQELGFDVIDIRSYEKPDGDVHLTDAAYQQLAHAIYERVQP